MLSTVANSEKQADRHMTKTNQHMHVVSLHGVNNITNLKEARKMALSLRQILQQTT